jgi:GcrA cell cycle regulator
MAATMGGKLGHDNHALGWLADRIERLKALWTRGLTASEIGNELGVSRNAVIGKIHRLKGYESARKPAGNKHARPPPKPPTMPAQPKPPPRRVVLNVPFLNLTIDELKAGVCRYPHGEAAPYRFCGGPTAEGSPYCALHRRMTLQRYQPPPPTMERRPHA